MERGGTIARRREEYQAGEEERGRGIKAKWMEEEKGKDQKEGPFITGKRKRDKRRNIKEYKEKWRHTFKPVGDNEGVCENYTIQAANIIIVTARGQR